MELAGFYYPTLKGRQWYPSCTVEISGHRARIDPVLRHPRIYSDGTLDLSEYKFKTLTANNLRNYLSQATKGIPVYRM